MNKDCMYESRRQNVRASYSRSKFTFFYHTDLKLFRLNEHYERDD